MDGRGLGGRRTQGGSGTITTVAGVGSFAATTGYSGDGGPATLAKMNTPYSIATSTGSPIFVADSLNHAIRVIDNAGVIWTYAGGNGQGYSGDGGPATLATLNDPTGLALDPSSGSLYVADGGNARVRVVSATTHAISLVAGNGSSCPGGDSGPATSLSLAVTSLALDATRARLYVGGYNYCVRVIDLGARTVATIAGTCASTGGYGGDGGPATRALFSATRGLAVDASGALFITDFVNYRIRKVDAVSRIVTTVAGDGSRGYSGDGGPATSAQLNNPFGLAVDAGGNLLIADTNNNVIRVVMNGSGVIQTAVGSGAMGYSGDGGPRCLATMNWPTGVASDGSGGVYIADSVRGVRVLPHRPMRCFRNATVNHAHHPVLTLIPTPRTG